MTDKEKAIIMAHTGICMLEGDKFQIFHRYIEDIMGRPIMTHEIGWLEDEIKERSKSDFIELCADESDPKEPNEWIPVSERLPKEGGDYLTTNVVEIIAGKEPAREVRKNFFCIYSKKWLYENDEVIAWMPLPKAYSEDKG